MKYYLAVDIGASSGRHILGWTENGRIRLEEIYRFDNGASMCDGSLCWDADGLFNHVLMGMKACAAMGITPVSVGIDTWGVDFVLLEKDGNRLGKAVAYRDKRTDGMDLEVSKVIRESELYARNGLQKQPFNTIYQLAALRQSNPQMLEQADCILLMPDYLHICYAV